MTRLMARFHTPSRPLEAGITFLFVLLVLLAASPAGADPSPAPRLSASPAAAPALPAPAAPASPAAAPSSEEAAPTPTASPSPAPAPTASPSPAPAQSPGKDPTTRPPAREPKVTNPELLRLRARLLARIAEDPIANVAKLRFSFHTFFGSGPGNKTSELATAQVVLPQNIGDWNIIHTTTVPMQYIPLASLSLPRGLSPPAPELALGDVTYTPYFSPRSWKDFTWGIGPTVSFPTASGQIHGAGKFLAGPALALVSRRGPMVLALVAGHQWSVAGDPKRADVSRTFLQPIFNYNLSGGWYITSSPPIAASWNSRRGQKWLVPVGGGIGRLFFVDRQPMGIALEAFHNAVKSAGSPDWSVRLQVQFLFPNVKDYEIKVPPARKKD